MSENVIVERPARRSPAPGFSGPWRALLLRALGRLSNGSLELTERGAGMQFGHGTPRARVRVNRPAFYRRMVLGGALGAAESYVDGDWDCDDLVALVRLFSVNRDALEKVNGLGSLALRLINLLQHMTRHNSVSGSRRNIHEHYDLSNDFFATFLDRRMMYSSAVFESRESTLDEASTAKLERLCRKLELRPTDHLLEIGTGWGGLAIYAADRYGCRVTTTTISQAQHDEAVRRVAEAGLQDRVTVLLEDYRNLRGTFDKLVSVEMVEAVGHQYLDQYFDICGKLLGHDGIMVLQGITIEDRRYQRALRTVDFIKKHIFPGSFIPSVSALVSAAARNSDMVVLNLEDIGLDYAATLRAWRDRFEANRNLVLGMGFDERFVRMWRFYLAYCEGGFRERAISDVQLIFAKPGYRGRAWRADL